MPEENILRQIEEAAGLGGNRSAPMNRLTSFGCGGPAAFVVEARTPERLTRILRTVKEHSLPWFIIGRGTNLLVADEGFPGVVIRMTGELDECHTEGSDVVCGAGALLSRAARVAAGSGLSGLERLAYIPGTLGGAITMNAGAHGCSIGDLVKLVEVCGPGGCQKLRRDEIDFGYRSSSLPPGQAVARVTLELTKSDEGAIREAMNSSRRLREGKQPGGERTFGSVFKNPAGGESAGSLLDQAGCKELRAGGAAVSNIHANFIINKGNATASDVVDLMNICRRRVFEKFAVVLEPEVRFLGEIKLDPLQ